MSWVPPQEYYRSLPKNIAGAGAILHEPGAGGRMLLVKPSYHTTWEIPGGGMDDGEYPWETACREVKEETGLDLSPGRLLAVDWVPPQDDGRPALANFVFDGGELTPAQARQRVRLESGEITGWRMAAPSEWDTLLAPHMARRVRACAEALASGGTAYLQHGWQLTARR
jgi:8-oxo-dGTP pyrophosphatase MutT (NUDIX family)